MAIEYLYDAIRATAGENIIIAAKITDENGENITSNCYVTLYDDSMLLATVDGTFDGEEWKFVIPANVTSDRAGRYWYRIYASDTSLCFKQPIYLI